MIVAFDLFGTVFDLSHAHIDDIRAYARHIRQPEWSPLKLPPSWEFLPAFPDSKPGIEKLRKKHFVVTCSNAPLGLTAWMSKQAGISWDAMIPLELNKVFKTNPKAYMTICEVLGVPPSEVCFISANKTFGDIEASRALGMRSILIRGDSEVKDILQLAESL